MSNPYSNLPPEHYWRSGVADVNATAMQGMYRKKFDIGFEDNIVTAGSCFAQHVAANMKKNGYNILEVETLPNWIDDDLAKEYGYRIYSARYGNIYTARQLVQLIKDCRSGTVRADDVWEKKGRFYDALRPSVEPNGLESVEEVLAHRRNHFDKLSAMLEAVDVFVFTLGLTEAWERIDSGTVYPTCPGVIAGTFDPSVFRFVNFNFFDVYNDMVEARRLLLEINPDMRFLFTVSPVPLTATASGDHVLVATTRSKSILRSVCSALTDQFDNVDYFPSYEVITSPSARSFFYESNLRSVSSFGVETVMKIFFSEHPPKSGLAVPEAAPAATGKRRKGGGEDKPRQAGRKQKAGRNKDDVVCEDALLEAFAQ